MEFQFGTNWSQFSQRSGGLIGQPLAMEGVFSFFLESAFLGLFLFGERRLSKWGHWAAAFLVFLGSWLSGYFIIVANAWMQHPVAYRLLTNGNYDVTSFPALLNNHWAILEYMHTMSGAVVTGAFVVAATGAFYVLTERYRDYGRIFLRMGVITGLISCILQVFPTGDALGKYTAHNQPTAIAGMEALFHSEKGAPLVILGQPNVEQQRIDNPLIVNRMLSFLIYGTATAEVPGLRLVPAPRLAHEHSVAVLRVPHNGRPGNSIRRADGTCYAFALARQTLRHKVSTLGTYAQFSVPIHREHGGLDVRGIGTSTVAHLWAHANTGRLFNECSGRQHSVHATRIHGPLCAALRSVHLIDVP